MTAIYVSEPRAARREAAEQLGADVLFDPTETDDRGRTPIRPTASTSVRVRRHQSP